LSSVTGKFPDDGALIRRLFLGDTSFRSACEDYATACSSLERLMREALPSRQDEIDDYRSVIAGLEVEIAEFLRRATKVHIE